MKKITFFLLLVFVFYSGFAQKQAESNLSNISNPHKQISVNKVYDENGNLIRYDSVYSYHYSSSNIGSSDELESFLKEFNKNIGILYSPFLKDEFFNNFFNDTVYKMDYNLYLKDIRRQHEEIINKFFKQLEADNYNKTNKTINNRLRNLKHI